MFDLISPNLHFCVSRMFSFIKKSGAGNSAGVAGTSVDKEEKERRKKEKKERKEKEKKEKGSMTADDLLRLDEVITAPVSLLNIFRIDCKIRDVLKV